MLEILRDSIWQFIGAIFGIIAIFISVGIYFLQRGKKSLTYMAIANSPLFTAEEEIKNDLEIFYKKKLVKNVQLLILKFINDGNQPILKADFEEPLSFRFNEDAEILSAEVISKTESLKVDLSIDKNRLTIKPLLLNNSDFIEIKFVINSYIGGHGKCEGRIVGVNNIELYVNPRSITDNFAYWELLLILLAGTFSFLLVYSPSVRPHIEDSYMSPLNILLVLFGIFAFLSMVILILKIYRNKTRKF